MFCNHRKARPAKDDAPLFDSGRWEMVPKADLIGEGKRTSSVVSLKSGDLFTRHSGQAGDS
jgi:hypothetical protein